MNGDKTMSAQGDKDPKTTKPAAKPQQQSQQKTKANTNKQKSGGAILGVFVFLIFLIAVAGIGAGYYVWLQMQQQLQAAEVERQALEHALSTLDENPRMQKFSRNFNKKFEQTNSQIAKIDKKLTTYGEQQQTLSNIVTGNNEILNRSQSGWMLKEIEHVLRMSQHRLLLDRDFAGAMAGLEAADNRLNLINDTRLIPVRQSIAKQTRTLKQFPHPDYTGIQLKIDNTISELKNGLLTAANEAQNSTSADAGATNQEQTNDEPITMPKSFDAAKFWELSKQFAGDASNKIKAALSDSVNITRGEQKIALFIEQQEKKRAYDFLRNKLLGAKYSVSTRDDIAYHQELNAALAWLESNDEFTNAETLAKEISSLNKYNLMPALPDISEPSVLLEKYMNTLKDKK